MHPARDTGDQVAALRITADVNGLEEDGNRLSWKESQPFLETCMAVEMKGRWACRLDRGAVVDRATESALASLDLLVADLIWRQGEHPELETDRERNRIST